MLCSATYNTIFVQRLRRKRWTYKAKVEKALVFGSGSLITAARIEMDSNLDIKALNDLIKLAESSTEEALEKEKESSFSPIITRAKSMVKNAIPDNLNKVKFTAMLQGKKQQISTEETDFNKKISLSINWMVTLIKDLLKKVNGQSELITALMNKFVSKDELNAELEKKVE